jgi:flagellar hook protein FlgE
MALIGSLNSGISALRNFARGLEVIGNNIANVNSIAFKGSRTKYTDSFSQFLKQPSTSPADGNGSNAPASQIGLGTTISGIQTSFLQGALTTTGQNTDLAVSGAGFFQVRNAQNNQSYATRAGDFRVDDQGYITTTDGFRLQGLAGGTIEFRTGIGPDGNTVFIPTVNTAQSTGDLRVDFNASFENGRLTRDLILVDANGVPLDDGSGGEISAVAALTSAAFTVDGSGQLVDSGGNVVNGPDGNPITDVEAGNYLVDGTGALVFDTNGDVLDGAAGDYLMNEDGAIMLGSNGDPLSVPTEAEVLNDVPKSIGFKFRPNGDLEVSLSDGSSFIGGRVLLMDFRDPTALVREGANLFSGFDAAGVIGGFNLTAADNTPGSYGLGVIQGGSLELSNVDLTEQFAELITTQRSFQAGSRIITVSDDILNEVVNLKR